MTSSGRPIFRAISTAKELPGIADRQLKERLHQVSVIEHGAVDDPFRVFREMLQVLVVSRDNAVAVIPVETVQQGFGNRTADLGFRTASELID